VNGPPSSPGEEDDDSYDESDELGRFHINDGDIPEGFPGLDHLDHDELVMQALDPEGHAIKQDNGWGGVLPILLLGFFGCFMYQQYQKSNARNGRGNPDHEEGAGLMDFCRGGRAALGNRTSDMLDRRRDKSLTGNDYSRGGRHDEDDDGML